MVGGGGGVVVVGGGGGRWLSVTHMQRKAMRGIECHFTSKTYIL